ncbi:methyltransferase-like protein 4 isoform X1 [Cynoglossus semilaevis]|uniref:Methyltransferase 4, N6-adenosine n=1 Tax=Cynoglossus semilaevis TaxID=244447 RepID=A0A3P8UJS2_CYNSE|nr:methyltransferase-like protein 4 isoform X1 [Cynoglossus semilaevis]
MAVVTECSHGWVLDLCPVIDQGYSHCIRLTDGGKSHVRCRFKRQCFQISKSHGSADVITSVGEGNVDKINKPLKKRKRKHAELNQGEIDARVYHDGIRAVISEGTKTLVDLAQSREYLKGVEDSVAEPLPLQECNLAALCDMAKELPLMDDLELEECAQALVAEDGGLCHVDLFSRVTENRSDQAAVVRLMGEEYVIPAHTSFLLSDFTRTRPLVNYGKKFDLIVMDPPWENKSVKRSRRYSALPSSQLKRLPVPLLASDNCLVVTWVTNRASHLRFVRDELYPHWGVEVVAEWFWVKVTSSGHFVFPLDSVHKKPYEVLVLGRYRSSSHPSISFSKIPEIPVEGARLIVSVPSALHSQKPLLSEVLRPYVGAEAKCLELFARNLHPGWTSWGNEVLKFQHSSYFTVTPVQESAEVFKNEDKKDEDKCQSSD